ncbi:phenylalanine--tRNA ligase subunit beta [Desulfonatronum thioautotrophicum]|uniref:phenylalanine--tRNA ligase subunit beta n=1 Tax=Desulfonatronum thioautotrophicum TaxID=617001 RepID=UPI0005EB3E09|nr:phenylalanine--tRNA ligase subunit beta [Desulfonatronum thioautotrophicum]
MLLSLNWLRAFTPYEGTAQQLADRLTMLGLEVEEISRPFAHLANVVVGRVLDCDRHPQSDRLSLCRVDIGQVNTLPIVCGAPNVAKGQLVAVAKIGTAFPDGKEITETVIRGQTSRGMICSESELGLGEDSNGIMVLEGHFNLGHSLARVLDLNDEVLDISVTPNRGDCLSVLGLAREVAAEFRLPLTLPQTELPEDDGYCDQAVAIVIDEPELCPLYQARIIRGIRIAPSPAWLQRRLLAVGQRPINNVVDVTNYILQEWGQPLHAFDLAKLAGPTIRVRRAEEGQRFITLDNRERSLLDSDLLITDAKKAVALAGVMGGANSEVTESTTDILLECAVFNPTSIRKTSRRLGLSSESSYRFERGVDQPGSALALERAMALIRESAGGRVLRGVAKSEPRPWQAPRIAFRPQRAGKLLGLALDETFCRTTLQALGCHVMDEDQSVWRVTPPGSRRDLEREADLIEEVGRCYGLDRIPSVLPRTAKSLDQLASLAPKTAFRRRIKLWGQGLGLTEVVNYSFVSTQELALMGLADAAKTITLRNPLSEEQNVLRPMLAPGLLQSVRHNQTQGNTTLRLFETAVVFQPDAGSETGAREPSRLGLALTGQRHPEGWPHPTESGAEPMIFFDLKGMVEHLLRHLRLPAATFQTQPDHPICLPCAEIILEGEPCGWLGQVRADIAESCHVRRELFLAEIDLDLLQRHWAESVQSFTVLPTYPPVRRDMTVISTQSLTYVAMREAIQSADIDLLQDIVLVDRFLPKTQPEADEIRHTLRLTYRHPERSLTNEEVDQLHQGLCTRLQERLPIRFS